MLNILITQDGPRINVAVEITPGRQSQILSLLCMHKLKKFERCAVTPSLIDEMRADALQYFNFLMANGALQILENDTIIFRE